MENASKALIMAGAILIALLIISLSVLVFSNFSGKAREAANMDEQEIKAFNSKLTPYLGSNVSGSQVNALLQYCLSVNISADKSGETYKKITVTGNSGASLGADKYTRVETNGKYYKVEGYYSDNGLMTTIKISK